MNKLVLIGNGFDLAHGLKTKYQDFLMWYLNSALQTLIKEFKYSDPLISSIIDFRVANPKKFNSIKEFKEFLVAYQIKFKHRFNFFEKLLDYAENPNWVDIESEYYQYLLSLFKTLEKGNVERHEHIDNEVKELNKCFHEIKEKLKDYLKSIESLPKNIVPDIANHFMSEFGNKKKNDLGNILFLNFNYTTTLEMYSNVLDPNNYKIIYIHGTLNDNNNPIIFGYGDEMDSYYHKIERLNSNDFLKYFKSFGYFKTSNYQSFSSFIDSDRFRVYIIGHSCGISDRILLNSIVEHKNCRSIKIYYYAKSNTENDYFKKMLLLSRHFRADFKGIMRNIISPFSKSEPLIKLK